MPKFQKMIFENMQTFTTGTGHRMLLNKKIQPLVRRVTNGGDISAISFDNYQLLQKITHEINQHEQHFGLKIDHAKSSELFSMIVIDYVMSDFISYYNKKNEKYNISTLATFIQNNININEQTEILTTCKEIFSECDYTKIGSHLLQLLILNALLNKNPAFRKYIDIIDNAQLKRLKSFKNLEKLITKFFKDTPKLKEDRDLIGLLEEPAKKYPQSIKAQLEYIRDNWGEYIGDSLALVLKALDVMKEDNKWGLPVPGESHIFKPGSGYDEPECFSQDRDWMPSLVLIAKNIFVWLHQLSKKYNRDIRTMDAIPEQELNELSQQGFRGLWLIGIWERSAASKRIKHLCGNQDAIASAYSLKRYKIADSLGGESAMSTLAEKAWKFGLRMGCDMVPNHMGIDSDWLYEHPDWFIQTDDCPFPSYSFSGENLSSHPDVEIYIEDGYYTRMDAAVVFKYIDHRDGRTRYIYHGNDGTSFPWNDTAQLNYLLPEVRHAVIGQILRIAEAFPVIRFDAAMTLSKKHFQRLWFPEPGSGGDIPSRASCGMNRAEFNLHMPVEFWREVVDIVADQAPDTLLLAEAFWLMEGYFVRTLGMHRVYNSAFMNMMKNEENSHYRESSKNVLEFDPQILKRFVNFMSNPDEETAVTQFGTDDKYFGTCTVMSTLPGLPMFAHGQIQGFKERYGMEFYKSHWDEQENKELVLRHEKEIFPLLRKRDMFCDVDNFFLFDFTLENGTTDENVFAYTNDKDGKKSLVLFHNKYALTKGWVRWTYRVHQNDKSEKNFVRKSLAQVMNIPVRKDHYVIYRDIQKNLEFIISAQKLASSGLYHELSAFKYVVYSEFRIIEDDEEHTLKTIAENLQGGGTRNIEKERKRVMYKELYSRFDDLISEETFGYVFSLQDNVSNHERILTKAGVFLEAISVEKDKGMDLNTLRKLYADDLKKTISIFREKFSLTHDQFYALFIWLITRRIGLIYDVTQYRDYSRKFIEEYELDERIAERLNIFTQSEFGYFAVRLIKILIDLQDMWVELKDVDCREFMSRLFDMNEVCELLECNEFEDILWFNKEAFDEFVVMLEVTQTLSLITTLNEKINIEEMASKLQECFLRIRKAYAFSEFKVHQFLNGLQ